MEREVEFNMDDGYLPLILEFDAACQQTQLLCMLACQTIAEMRGSLKRLHSRCGYEEPIVNICCARHFITVHKALAGYRNDFMKLECELVDIIKVCKSCIGGTYQHRSDAPAHRSIHVTEKELGSC